MLGKLVRFRQRNKALPEMDTFNRASFNQWAREEKLSKQIEWPIKVEYHQGKRQVTIANEKYD
jgi:hypothetical protein